jgi:hypothetical protein
MVHTVRKRITLAILFKRSTILPHLLLAPSAKGKRCLKNFESIRKNGGKES